MSAIALDPLIAEAKARARRRRLLALGLLAVVSAGAVGVTLGTRTAARPPAAASPGVVPVLERAPVWDFGDAGGGVTWAMNGREVWLTGSRGRTWLATPIPRTLRFPGFFSGAEFVDRRHGWIVGLTRAGPKPPTQRWMAAGTGIAWRSRVLPAPCHSSPRAWAMSRPLARGATSSSRRMTAAGTGSPSPLSPRSMAQASTS